jgi:tetratricopeptide (TPR) repeat protein
MQRSINAVMAFAIFLLAAPAWAASKQDTDDCNYITGFDRQLAACTRIIDDGSAPLRERVVAYLNRGLGYRSIAQKKNDAAVADFDQAIRLDPTYADAYSIRGDFYLNVANDVDRAIADYGEAVKLDPKNVKYWKARANAWSRKRDLDHAIADWGQAIVLDPTDADLYDHRAEIAMAKRDFDRAIADYGEAMKLNSTAASRYRTSRGVAFVAKGDIDRGLADFDEVIKSDPKDIGAHFARALAYGRKGDYDRAIADYDWLIKAAPSEQLRLGYLRTRGDMWFAKGDYARSVADYGEAIRISPNDADAYNLRCRARAFLNRDLAAALADCNASLRLVPQNNIGALTARGLVHQRLGRLDEAIADYDAALKVYPGFPFALYGRGLTKLRKGDRAGGDADIAAAKAIFADIAKEFAKYGLVPS